MSAAELLRDAKPSTTRVCKSVIIKGAMRWAKAPGQVRLIAQQLYPDGSWRNVPIVEVTAQEIAEAFTSNDTVSFHPPSPKATVVAPAPPAEAGPRITQRPIPDLNGIHTIEDLLANLLGGWPDQIHCNCIDNLVVSLDTRLLMRLADKEWRDLCETIERGHKDRQSRIKTRDL